MLKNEGSQAESVPAAQVRVTPEELAAAITQIEARKDAGQRQAEGTVPIGEVVQQLGLDTTPEEVLAQVQADRARQAAQQRKRLSVKQRVGGILAVGAVLIGLAALNLPPGSLGPQSVVVTNVPNTSFVIDTSPIDTSSRPQHIRLDPHLLVGDASGKLVMLSEVGDNQPVHCGYSDGEFQQYSPAGPLTDWTLVKHGGHVYVRGWMLRMSNQARGATGADISAFGSEGTFVVPVTLPINGFQLLPNGGSNVPNREPDSAFHAQDIHLDKHAWEKW